MDLLTHNIASRKYMHLEHRLGLCTIKMQTNNINAHKRKKNITPKNAVEINSTNDNTRTVGKVLKK